MKRLAAPPNSYGLWAVCSYGHPGWAPGRNLSPLISYNTLTTPKAGQFDVTLPDGRKVWLNNASSVRYPTIMNGGKRVVELQVEALGTHFNIIAYSEENVDEVAWNNGYFQFTSSSLPGVMRQLARWYDMEAEYHGPIAPQAFNGLNY